MTPEGNTLLQIKKVQMPLFIPSSNLYQQTGAGHHTNNSENNITTSLNLSSHQTHILIFQIERKLQQHPLSQDIITLPMTTITNSSLNKHPMSWELTHRSLLQPSDSFMKAMCCHHTLNDSPRHCPKKLNQLLCKICSTAIMTTFTKGTTIDTINLQPGELIHM